MVDPGTGLVALGVGLGGKDLVVKILGPTAEYVGTGLAQFTRKRAENLQRIFEKAGKKLGEGVDSPGAVPPRVLAGILNAGSYCDNELAAEYFGGVLASSRSGILRDDRGAYFNDLVASLSTYQLRLHYAAYHLFKNVHDGKHAIPFGIEEERRKLRIFIPETSYIGFMDLQSDEVSRYASIKDHCIFGLIRLGLLDAWFQFGGIEHVGQYYPEADTPGIILQPSPLGVELFFWAYGVGNKDVRGFLNPEAKFPLQEGLSLEVGAKPLTE